MEFNLRTAAERMEDDAQTLRMINKRRPESNWRKSGVEKEKKF